MSIPHPRTMKRRPTHPGEMLREDFIARLRAHRRRAGGGVRRPGSPSTNCSGERRALSPEMALRLSRLFGNSAEFWLNAQRSVDLWEAGQAIKDDVARIKPLRVA
ncbi:MAG: HigA family addiction module antidote protein [Gemmatimonadetes bacterium]|nr:HigA family addiction module antidote protein [Gemmatimonadota bacterium]